MARKTKPAAVKPTTANAAAAAAAPASAAEGKATTPSTLTASSVPATGAEAVTDAGVTTIVPATVTTPAGVDQTEKNAPVVAPAEPVLLAAQHPGTRVVTCLIGAGRRRGGHRWVPGRNVVNVTDLSEEQWQEVERDPMLSVSAPAKG